ncbi:hypothetical protein HOU02_gp072 [Caulobacter phage CcrBL9]|uniref:Uncharacterized protein n=1 Tax=Caulobacter phage CcrBL9 TaxID=2283270 RepID=A0A385EBL6_9CAUD|nr:hypothetical protein HOU02_gp072 [Caulobacter phage CcrBL9]AXQ69096.1 hypothetical protein CcrBL9_gp072c [Caulobacter phage CcrBL9]
MERWRHPDFRYPELHGPALKSFWFNIYADEKRPYPLTERTGAHSRQYADWLVKDNRKHLAYRIKVTLK